jgi:ParB family chromosome partitioning protein
MTARKPAPAQAADPETDSGGITQGSQAGDVHWERPGAESVAACSGRETHAPLTTDRQLVTCDRCRKTRAWIRSAGSESESRGTDSAEGGGYAGAMLPLAEVAPHPANPRGAELGDLAELTASVAEVGILQPLVVASVAAHLTGDWPAVAAGAAYVILAGHRRRAAAEAAGLTEVPAIVRDDLAGADALVVMLAENDPAKRRALEPLAEARAFAALAERGWSQRQIAQRVGCGQAHVSKRTALLKLPEPAIEALAAGKLTAADAGELAKLAEQPEVVTRLLDEIGPGEYHSAGQVVTRHVAQAERDRRTAELLAEAAAAGIEVVDYSRLGNDAYLKRLDEDADPAPHQEAGCLAATISGGRRDLYCTKPGQHAGTAAEVPAWTRHNGGKRAAEDTARAAVRRQADAAARARKVVAAQLAAQPVPPARAAELLAAAMLLRHTDAQCLDAAVRWLRAAGIGPTGGDHYQYAAAVSAGGSAADIRRLAVAMALAGDERATATTGQGGQTNEKWAGRQVAYLDRLINEAGYQPGEWEQAQLAEARVRVAARGELSCPACGCRHGRPCGKYGYDQAASRYLSCDAEPGEDGTWSYYCNCVQAAGQDDEARADIEAGRRDDLFDAVEALVFVVDAAGPVADEMGGGLAEAVAGPAGELAEAFAEQDGDGDTSALLQAVRAVHEAALPYVLDWPSRLQDAVAELDELGALGADLVADEDGGHE